MAAFELPREGAARQRVHDHDSSGRAHGEAARQRRRVRADAARPRIARRRWARPPARAARPRRDAPDDRAHRPRRGRREGGRPRGRGRRLRYEAVPLRGAARAGARAPAHGRDAGGDHARGRRGHARPAHAQGGGGRPDGHPDRARVHDARDAHAPSRPGPQPRAASLARLGLRLRPGLERRRRVRRLPPAQGRGSGDRDRARNGLPAAV